MTSTYAGLLRKKHRRTPVLLDANLLLLLLVGTFDPALVQAFKRLTMFHQSDLLALNYFIADFSIMTTPHILTEVSNLANALPQSIRARFYPYMATKVHLLNEIQLASSFLVSQSEFTSFGLTDAALSTLAQNHLLITSDGRLASHLRASKGLPILTLRDIVPDSRGVPA